MLVPIDLLMAQNFIVAFREACRGVHIASCADMCVTKLLILAKPKPYINRLQVACDRIQQVIAIKKVVKRQEGTNF